MCSVADNKAGGQTIAVLANTKVEMASLVLDFIFGSICLRLLTQFVYSASARQLAYCESIAAVWPIYRITVSV